MQDFNPPFLPSPCTVQLHAFFHELFQRFFTRHYISEFGIKKIPSDSVIRKDNIESGGASSESKKNMI